MKIGGKLSKREGQIMDLVYERREITAADIEASLAGAPSNSAVRFYLRSLETKGFLQHEEEGGRFVYSPCHAREDVARVETHRLLKTFFGGSVSEMMATLLSEKETKLSSDELQDLQRMIDRAKEEA